MEQPKELYWTESTRNRFSKALHGAMLTPQGYKFLMGIKPIGSPEKQFFNVKYDREYILEWLAIKFFKPLECVDQDELESLLNEAYLKVHSRSKKKARLKLLETA